MIKEDNLIYLNTCKNCMQTVLTSRRLKKVANPKVLKELISLEISNLDITKILKEGYNLVVQQKDNYKLNKVL